MGGKTQVSIKISSDGSVGFQKQVSTEKISRPRWVCLVPKTSVYLKIKLVGSLGLMKLV